MLPVPPALNGNGVELVWLLSLRLREVVHQEPTHCPSAPCGFSRPGSDRSTFIPGILRIIDLFFYYPLAAHDVPNGSLGPASSFVYKRSKAIRRHGYLIACIAHKPSHREGSDTPKVGFHK